VKVIVVLDICSSSNLDTSPPSPARTTAKHQGIFTVLRKVNGSEDVSLRAAKARHTVKLCMSSGIILDTLQQTQATVNQRSNKSLTDNLATCMKYICNLFYSPERELIGKSP